MFGCTSVYSLDLSNFDTSNVTNMQGMFDHLPKIGVLDLTSFDTSNAIIL
jgi:surface protein